MAVHLPRESATWRALHGQDKAEWSLDVQMLAEVLNAVRWLQWAKTEDGAKGRNRPKPIQPPWVEDPDRETRHFGSNPVPLDELHHFLGWEAELRT